MNKFWIILSHTYMSKVKSKSFIISTLITLVFLFGIANLDVIINFFSQDDKDTVAVIDESDQLFAPFKETVESTNPDIELVKVEDDLDTVLTDVENETYEALIVLSLNNEQMPEGTYYANRISDFGMHWEMEQQLQQLKIAMATNLAGIDQAIIEQIYEPISFQTVALDEDAKTGEEMSQTRGIVYIMLFVLYMAVIIYGQMIASDVATEKSSRVMEILVSSAPPVSHMFAKIFGVALLGLTQVGIFIGVGYGLIVSKLGELTGESQGEFTGEFFEVFGIGDTSPALYIYALIFFLLGYLLYATLAAMLGSIVSSVEDVQQIMMPMVFLIIIAFFIAMFGLSVPDTTFITVSSYIPFFTPMVMFLRVGMLNIPVWEIALSFGILIVSIILLAMLAARVYKGGVLMYGRSNSFKDFKKALALSKKER